MQGSQEKKGLSPAIIVGAIAAVAILLFVLYRQIIAAPPATVNPATANQIPEYAQKTREGQAGQVTNPPVNTPGVTEQGNPR